jgi:hypothetical protein
MTQRRRNPNAHRFLFATGIENSYPTIAGKDGQTERVDEMAKTFFYDRWREDFALVRELGLRYLRYGPPYYLVHQGPEEFDWAFTDETLAELRRLEIVPHRGSVPLRRAGLGRWLPEPGLVGPLRALRPGVRGAVSMGALLYPRE